MARYGKGRLDDRLFWKGQAVRLSAKWLQRSRPRFPKRHGTIAATPLRGSPYVGVIWDGTVSRGTMHQDFIEPVINYG